MEKQFKYEITLSFDLGRAVPKIEDFADGVSENMKGFGLDGRLVIRSEGISLTLISYIEFNTDQKKLLKEVFEKDMNERFQMWDWKVEGIKLLK